MDSSLISIRKAVASDAATIWKLRELAVLSGCAASYPADVLRAWTSGNAPEGFDERVAENFHVAVVDEMIAGSGAIDLHSGKVDAIFVHPEYMRRGVAGNMMRFLEGLARKTTLDQLHLDASLNAAEFYRSCGFVGDTVSIYHSPRGFSFDCIPMTKKLI